MYRLLPRNRTAPLQIECPDGRHTTWHTMGHHPEISPQPDMPGLSVGTGKPLGQLPLRLWPSYMANVPIRTPGRYFSRDCSIFMPPCDGLAVADVTCAGACQLVLVWGGRGRCLDVFGQIPH